MEKDKDFVLLQEVKAIGFTLETNLKFIWNNASSLTSKHEKRERRNCHFNG